MCSKVVFYVIIRILQFENALGAVPLSQFYPFGVRAGDSALAPNDDGFSRVDLALGEQFQFLNVSYNQIFVNTNGGISFIRGVTSFTPRYQPSATPMIVPFWADINTLIGGVVHYRETMERELLQNTSTEISLALPTLPPLMLGWMFVATWDEVAPFGENALCPTGPKRNTFQMALAKDGLHSFVIFNYNKITWTTGSANSGDHCGLGGITAKAGFDLGDNSTLHTIPGSCTNEVINLTQTSNIGKPGKWIFKIDTAVISAQPEARCVNATFNTLRIYPAYVSLLGRAQVQLSGPCLVGAVELLCVFKDSYEIQVPAKLTSESSVKCRVPYLSSEGRIPVALSLNFNTSNSSWIKFPGFIYTFIPRRELRFQISNQVSTSSEAFIQLSWNPRLFEIPGRPSNATYKVNIVEFSRRSMSWVDVGIVKNFEGNYDNGYFEGFADNSSILAHLISSYFVRLDAERAVLPPNSSRRNRLRNRRKRSLHSGFLHTNYNKSSEYFDNQCIMWHRLDAGPPRDVRPCPPTLNQAIIDNNFIMERRNDRRERFSNQFTFRQRVPSPSGSGQTCVYEDGEILVSRNNGGSADLKSSVGPRGAVNHLTADILPWHWCCGYSSSDHFCDLYYDKRPSDAGSNYVAARLAVGKGDPHMTTFDMLEYTFNGVGEFWMIKSKQVNTSNPIYRFEMQCRMEKFINQENNVATNASAFTGFAFQQVTNLKNEIHVQVTLSPVMDGLIVTLDKYLLPLFPPHQKNISSKQIEDSSEEEEQLVDGEWSIPEEQITVANEQVSITINSSNGNVVLSFTSGFSFEILTLDNRTLSVKASVHPNIANVANFSGLLGNADGDPNNDLQDQNNTLTDRNSSLQQIHENFGTKWRTDANDSLFLYHEGESHASFQDEGFTPSLWNRIFHLFPKSCLFDYVNTGGDRAFAENTKIVEKGFQSNLEIFANVTEMCKALPHLENGWYKYKNLLVGSSVQVKCNKGFIVIGTESFKCELIQEEDNGEEEEERETKMRYDWGFSSGIPKCTNQSNIWIPPGWLDAI